ncbi:hypothetical protein [Micromonospora sp. NBS 11-29]|uniref:hypothetical protein n=1 Tax=Micromonospora sp. NBS 11-29 TaxID=1960879 RepID=UPI0020CB7DD3|nr:hypothetical protein [Micromonospora sp. NBS 11-29]
MQFWHPITVRVIREIADRHPFDGWAWIEAYELDGRGDAVAKRELFVQPAGLRWLDTAASDSPALARPAARLRVPA